MTWADRFAKRFNRLERSAAVEPLNESHSYERSE